MIERKIPNLSNVILSPMIGWEDSKRTPENYTKEMEKFERKCEKSTIKTLAKLGINGLVKTDPYSLPFNNEVIAELPGESYLGGAWEFYRALRPFVKELLDKDLTKIRFYIYVEVQDRKQFFMMGSVKYHFRYHEPKN